MSIDIHEDEAGLRDAIGATLAGLAWRNNRDHELLVLTCYVDFAAVDDLIKVVAAKVRLKRARLMFDFSELYRRRTPLEAKRAITASKRRCAARGVVFEATPLQVETLMHAKGYGIVQRSRDAVTGGAVWITSCNATSRGLGLQNSNFEISTCSREAADVVAFSDICDGLVARYEVAMDRPVARAREYALMYGILASGVYLHRWSLPLAARLALRYDLDKEASSRAVRVEGELLRRGLALERSSLTYRPLNIEAPRLFPASFARTYTLATLKGRWCPKPAWEEVCAILDEDDEVRRFKEEVLTRTTPERLARGAQTAYANDAYLVGMNLIEEDEDRVERWRARLELLRDDDEKLTRICLSMEASEFPHRFEDRNEVVRTWESLVTSERIARRESKAKGLLRRAQESGDPSALALGDEERNALVEMFEEHGHKRASRRDADLVGQAGK